MNQELLLRYLASECSETELLEINEWVKQSPENAEWLFDMERLWCLHDELRFSDPNVIESAYTKFSENINSRMTHNMQKPDSAKITLNRRSILQRIASYAAVFVIISLIGINIYQANKTSFNGNNNIVVPAGQAISLTLSDGTKVWLNAESRLEYPASFQRGSREVKLEGEGYFEVAHNEKAPFHIHTNELDITVLGTRFNIRSYDDEPDKIVTLSEGSVKVSRSGSNSSIILKPNEQAIYSDASGLLRRYVETTQDSHSWTDGELVFSDVPLSNIVRTIERHFGVKVVLRDGELADELFTCHTQPNTSLIEVLNLLQSTRNLDYEMTEREVVLYKPGK